jgi:chromosome segregation ATPase
VADNERLASLEAKLEFLKDLLLEVRQDIKALPTKNDYEDLEQEISTLEERISSLETARVKDSIKIGITSALMGFIAALLVRFLI